MTCPVEAKRDGAGRLPPDHAFPLNQRWMAAKRLGTVPPNVGGHGTHGICPRLRQLDFVVEISQEQQPTDSCFSQCYRFIDFTLSVVGYQSIAKAFFSFFFFLVFFDAGV